MSERYPYPNPESDENLWYGGFETFINNDLSWAEEGFDLKSKLSQIDGPVLEIAGPTHDGYVALDEAAILPDQVLTSNVSLPQETEKLHLLADGRKLPLGDQTLSVVLVSALTIIDESVAMSYDLSMLDVAHKEYADYGKGIESDMSHGHEYQKTHQRNNLRISTMEEASRVLKTGGILIWQFGLPEDIEVARLNGLELKERIIGKSKARIDKYSLDEQPDHDLSYTFEKK